MYILSAIPANVNRKNKIKAAEHGFIIRILPLFDINFSLFCVL